MIKVRTPKEKKKILDNTPWSVLWYVFIVKVWKLNQFIEDVDFNSDNV